MFQYRFFRTVSIAPALLCALFFLCAIPKAHSAITYTIDPLVIDETLEARDIKTFTISITNNGTQPISAFPTVNNISLTDGGTLEAFLPPVSSDRTRSLASWIEISRLGIQVPIGVTKTVPLTIRMHHAPEPGIYHAFIGFGDGRNRDEATQAVMDGRAPGTVVTVVVEDKKIEALKLATFFVDRFVTSPTNASARYVFKNPGDEPLAPTGEIIFYNSSGKEVGSSVVNPDNVVISPGEEHVFETTVPADGLFGKYKAFLNVTYGESQTANVHDTSFFYVIPLRTVLIILGLLILIVALTAWYMHKKYFDEELIDDSEQLMLRMKEGVSDSVHHDIDLKKKV